MRVEITISKVKDEDKDKPKVLQNREEVIVTIQGDKELVDEVQSKIEDRRTPDWEVR